MSALLISLLKRTDELEALYPKSREYLNSLRKNLIIFVPATVAFKDDKEETRVRSAYEQSGSYTSQLAALSIIKDIEVSHILGCNSYVIPHLVQEYAKLRTALRGVESCFDKMKQFPKVFEACSAIKGAFEKDKVALYMRDDLAVLSREFSVDVDFDKCMENFKGYGK